MWIQIILGLVFHLKQKDLDAEANHGQDGVVGIVFVVLREDLHVILPLIHHFPCIFLLFLRELLHRLLLFIQKHLLVLKRVIGLLLLLLLLPIIFLYREIETLLLLFAVSPLQRLALL